MRNVRIATRVWARWLVLVIAVLMAGACARDPLSLALHDSDETLIYLLSPSSPNPCAGLTDAWSEYDANPIIPGGGADGVDRAYYPAVIKAGNLYHIWYGDGSNTRHAVSASYDFSDAVFPAAVVTGLVATGPYHPRVLYNEAGWDIGTPSAHYAGPFLMYYTDGNNWTNFPRVAHSADGSSWTDIGACTGVNSYGGNTTVYNLAVLHEGGNVWKAYADNGLGHIQCYTSGDGLAWAGQASDIVVPTQAWESPA